MASCSTADGWRPIRYPTKAVARMLLVGFGISIAQQAVGVDAVQHYLLDALNGAGIRSESLRIETMILLSLVKIAFIIMGGKACDIGGRRKQLFTSLTGMILALTMLGIVYWSTRNLNPFLAVFGLSLYLSFYSLGMGPIGSLIPAEIFPTSIRAKATSIVISSNRIVATIISSTFVLTDWMSWSAFFIFFAIVCILVMTFVYVYIPETKGRSLEDMSLYFAEITRDEIIVEAERNAAALEEQAMNTINEDEPLIMLKGSDSDKTLAESNPQDDASVLRRISKPQLVMI